MDAILTLSVAALGGYLLGSMPFAVIVSKAFGLDDPRSHGSGNPGATNVLRTGNKTAAAITLIGDAAKGWLAMFLATKLGADSTAMAVAGVSAFVGHVFPFTLGFKGGKGVATALGVMLGFSAGFAGIAAITWLAVVIVTRYSSLAALVAALEAPLLAWWLFGDTTITLTISVMSLVLIARHRSNIRNLIAGTEGRIGSKKSA
jgi:glycerol-3-phosphate acyltransferase PlsY